MKDEICESHTVHLFVSIHDTFILINSLFLQATAFSDMINVSYVDLSKNQLYELSPESLDGINIVEHLDLMENPWHCNCSIHWMRAVSVE